MSEGPAGGAPDARVRQVLGLIGLGLRARTVVVGVEQVRQAAKGGSLLLAFVGHDAAEHSRAKVEPLLSARQVRMSHLCSAAELGEVSGREAVAALGVLDPALARGIVDILEGTQGQRDGVAGGARGRAGRDSTGRAG